MSWLKVQENSEIAVWWIGCEHYDSLDRGILAIHPKSASSRKEHP